MEGVIFDLDGVLVDSMPAHFQAWKAAFAKIDGLEITERDIYLLEGSKRTLPTTRLRAGCTTKSPGYSSRSGAPSRLRASGN